MRGGELEKLLPNPERAKEDWNIALAAGLLT